MNRALVELSAESRRLGLPYVSVRREWAFRTWYREPHESKQPGFYGVRPLGHGEDFLGKDSDEARVTLRKLSEKVNAPEPVAAPVEQPLRATASRKRKRP